MNSIAVAQVLVSLAIVAGGWIAGYALYHGFQWLAQKAEGGRYRIDALLLRILGPPLSVAVALVALNVALYRIPAIQEQFAQWDGAQRAVLLLTGTWILASLVKTAVREYGLPFAQRTDTDIDERIVRLLDLTAVYVIWMVGILLALGALGIQVTAFLASLGIAGLAVALAAKTILSNVLTGVTLTADRNFRVGDRIAVYSGDDGTSLELMLRGGKGNVSVTANVAPRLMAQVREAAVSGDEARARKLDETLAPLNRKLFLEANPIPAKWALNQMGLIGPGIRLPLTPLSPEYHEDVLEALKSAGCL